MMRRAITKAPSGPLSGAALLVVVSLCLHGGDGPEHRQDRRDRQGQSQR